MANTTGMKFGGRTKGTPNKNTVETKNLIQAIVHNELDLLQDLLEQLEPVDRVNAIAKLLPYVVPKQSEIKFDDEVTNIVVKINRDA
jgi:hypothetical protein